MTNAGASGRYPAMPYHAPKARGAPTRLAPQHDLHQSKALGNAPLRHQYDSQPLSPGNPRALRENRLVGTAAGLTSLSQLSATPAIQNSADQISGPSSTTSAGRGRGIDGKSAIMPEEYHLHVDNLHCRQSAQPASNPRGRLGPNPAEGRHAPLQSNAVQIVHKHADTQLRGVPDSTPTIPNTTTPANTTHLAAQRPESYPGSTGHPAGSARALTRTSESGAQGHVRERLSLDSQARHLTVTRQENVPYQAGLHNFSSADVQHPAQHVLDRRHIGQSAHTQHTAFANTLVSPPSTTLPSSKEVHKATRR